MAFILVSEIHLMADCGQEKLEGIIELPESLEVVKAMLSFLYKRCYHDRATRPLEFNAQVYIAAVKYNIIALGHYAAFGKISTWLESFRRASFDGGSSTHSPDLHGQMLEFLEVIVLVYTNTHEESDILRREIADTARKVLRHHTPVLDDGWAKCFSRVPAFVLDLVKQEDNSNMSSLIFGNWAWRTNDDCVMRECNVCDTMVSMSKEAWDENARDDEYMICPNHDCCDGTLINEIPVAKCV
jgi:hypothetical protein